MACLGSLTGAEVRQFFNLTAQEVKVDSLLPMFSHSMNLGAGYADSVYTVSIEYPEFYDMSEADVERCRQLTDLSSLPELPVVEQYVGVSRKSGTLYLRMVPIVKRQGKYQKLVSFMLRVRSQALSSSSLRRASQSGAVYASHSVLSSGRWAKIRVSQTGVHELSSSLIKKAGFTDLSKVKVYGYGGAMQPEKLTPEYLTATDDLTEVPLCTVGGRRLFYATGPVSWSNSTSLTRTRNPYSNYGYYFLTESDTEPAVLDSAAFLASFYPSPDDYHSLAETDDFSWYHGGRNLFESSALETGVNRSYTLDATSAKGQLTVLISYDGAGQVLVFLNGHQVGTASITNTSFIGQYVKAASSSWTFPVDSLLTGENEVILRKTSGDGTLRLDYLSLCCESPAAAPSLAGGKFPEPVFDSQVTNQDLHGDAPTDMVIIIPASRKLLTQAQRIQQLHQEKDGLRVRIVAADELYNEFSSGTPDANAYRRYLKMLYDRAETEADMPRYLLLMGDGAWDNRMLTVSWNNYSPDDFLLCYESENSFSATDCYVSDDYFCLMDDNEGGDMLTSDKPDVAVGRFPARTEAEAQVLVDKTLSYRNNELAGAWQNTLCFMGDDGNNNIHMADADTAVVRGIQRLYPALNIRKIYWDAYPRTASSTGFSYPDVTRLIKQQMQQGALVMNYTGHGAPYTISHEQVVSLSDFAAATSLRLPLWVTASCDIMPFDGQEENIGETAMLNKQGGSVAFYGTTRTVYAQYNRYMNKSFMLHVLGTDAQGRRISIGEAARLAKNELIANASDRTANKLQYTLLGDPALVLAAPTMNMVVDSINGRKADAGIVNIGAGEQVTVTGHVVDAPDFQGVMTAVVRDVEETVTCKLNADDATAPFVFKDRLNTLYVGSDSVRDGRFSFTFALSKDLSYSDATGLITLYAVSADKSREAHGEYGSFTMGGDSLLANDGIGPNIYCYLNSPSFVNGGDVNTTPYFYAELTDKDGINASGSGIGHDLELIIDGELSQTYQLNDYFQYDFGNYQSGSVGFSIPTLSYGPHKLLFRAWDVFNNSSTAQLDFNVVKGQEPSLFDVSCTRNPATTQTTFIINHDRAGSELTVELEIFDTSGRQLWKHSETGVAVGNTYTMDWDLCIDGGRRLMTGVYLYRIRLSGNGSNYASLAKKIIILKQ